MTTVPVSDRRPYYVGYVLGAGVLTAIASSLLDAGSVPGWVLFLVVLVYLGPLGLAALLVVGLPMALIFVAPASPLVVVLLAIGVAVVNVALFHRWRTRTPPVRVERAAPLPRWHAAVASVLFLLAGCGFVLLSYVAGFAALTAGGVDFRVPAVEADRVRLIAAITWWPGLAIAITGLVLWIVRARRGQTILIYACVDLALIVTLLTVMTLSS
jgi:hypothetical protein